MNMKNENSGFVLAVGFSVLSGWSLYGDISGGIPSLDPYSPMMGFVWGVLGFVALYAKTGVFSLFWILASLFSIVMFVLSQALLWIGKNQSVTGLVVFLGLFSAIVIGYAYSFFGGNSSSEEDETERRRRLTGEDELEDEDENNDEDDEAEEKGPIMFDSSPAVPDATPSVVPQEQESVAPAQRNVQNPLDEIGAGSFAEPEFNFDDLSKR